jgi:sugar/nucleoside kinase (ribokinase family)
MLTWDQILNVDQFPLPGGYQIVRDKREQSGGTTGNMAVALARLGIDVSIASRVGDDEVGQMLIDQLQLEGCNIDYVTKSEGVPTDRGTIIVSGQDGTTERTILWLQGARLKHGDYLPIEEFFAKDLVIVDVDDPRLRLLLLDLPMHVSPRTRILGTMTFLTEAEPHQALELALRHDYLCGTVAELMYATGETSTEAAIERFQREMILSQVRFALITDGPRGCYVVERESVEHLPAFEIDSVDPTGAGDAFAAGAAYAIIHHWDVMTTAKFANVMGALATRSFGARSSLPSLLEVHSFLQKAQTGSSNAGSSSKN